MHRRRSHALRSLQCSALDCESLPSSIAAIPRDHTRADHSAHASRPHRQSAPLADEPIPLDHALDAVICTPKRG